MTLGPDFFRPLYAVDPDPWSLASRWYEQRKYALTMASLTRPRYRHVFEPGCSVGVLTEHLAARCDRLLAWDLDPTARAQAGDRVRTWPNVTVHEGQVPADWPVGRFDLVVLSEIGYYLGPDDLGLLVERAHDSLEPGGELVLAHWRHEVPDYPGEADTVHAAFAAHQGLRALAEHLEEDFRLDVLTRTPPAPQSVAAREGLC
ncbi:SAM-dependent methyltransferase [Actinokineospora sp. NBRC 105648]|uniref:SAM-dependent methyltransferase n=1 Tax=Actinokineospora sp. NBRC 105648 TaxID=3032206 RepID=UPI0024A03C06|nr:SAM-dependent methyltransferase [Actinokineospora sp. NBRC 105648]GLZ43747.1 methyltransferase [Actinokineospora sp. NBRC 105648]